uniref:Actin n=1 Tax=Bionectria ochroleuca TaxID=29856 RepID=A0A8H7N8A5_BIOOC
MQGHPRAIVIDNGSHTIRGGLSGEKTPSAVFPSLISRRRDTSAFIAQGQIDWYAGEEVDESRIGFSPPRHPVDNGIITNADDMELLWKYLFDKKLQCDTEDSSILLTEPALNSKGSREKAATALFEYFNIGALNLSTQESLALCASGRNTGLIVDSGLYSTRIVPIYEGLALRHGIQRLDIGGQQMTDYFIQTLQDSGNGLETRRERALAANIKEEYCYVAQGFEGEARAFQEGHSLLTETGYTLVDGKRITVGKEKVLAPEVLFQPHLMGLNGEAGIQHLAAASIAKSDVSIKDNLYGNIVLAGGSSMFPGIESRMQAEMTRLFPSPAKVGVHASAERKHSAWIGGAMLSSLSTFRSMCILAAEYDEIGPGIVHRRFL